MLDGYGKPLAPVQSLDNLILFAISIYYIGNRFTLDATNSFSLTYGHATIKFIAALVFVFALHNSTL